MNKIKVYDLPTRMFHWLFAGLFIIAFFIAKTIDDDSPVYAYHMLAGMILVFLVLLRIIWGVIGSRYARFASFKLNPMHLVQYFSTLLKTQTQRYAGHNPASSYSTLLMLGFTLGLGITGVLMAKGINKELFEEIHELFAHGLLFTVIGHVIGVVFHQIKHRDGMATSMFTGLKHRVEGENGLGQNYFGVAVLFIGLSLAFTLYLQRNYDTQAQQLKLFGVTLQLGEDEHAED